MPSGPSVLVLPGTGKDFNRFHSDDLMCRQLAHEQIATERQRSPIPTRKVSKIMTSITFNACMAKGIEFPYLGN